MDISEQTLIELVKGQAKVAQSVEDMTKRIDLAIPYLNTQDIELGKRIDNVEHKVWYFGGAGSLIGVALGLYKDRFISLLGGK
jgi:hypothetical protein